MLGVVVVVVVVVVLPCLIFLGHIYLETYLFLPYFPAYWNINFQNAPPYVSVVCGDFHALPLFLLS